MHPNSSSHDKQRQTRKVRQAENKGQFFPFYDRITLGNEKTFRGTYSQAYLITVFKQLKIILSNNIRLVSTTLQKSKKKVP